MDVRKTYKLFVNGEFVRSESGRAYRPDGGKVCVFVGDSASANARERRDGFFQGAGA